MEDCDYYWIGLVVVFVTVCVGLLYDKLEKSCMQPYTMMLISPFNLQSLDCKRESDEFSSLDDLEFQEEDSFQDSNSTERNEESSFSSSSRDEFLA